MATRGFHPYFITMGKSFVGCVVWFIKQFVGGIVEVVREIVREIMETFVARPLHCLGALVFFILMLVATEMVAIKCQKIGGVGDSGFLIIMAMGLGVSERVTKVLFFNALHQDPVSLQKCACAMRLPTCHWLRIAVAATPAHPHACTLTS